MPKLGLQRCPEELKDYFMAEEQYLKPPEKWESIALRFIGGQKAPTGKSKTLEKLWTSSHSKKEEKKEVEHTGVVEVKNKVDVDAILEKAINKGIEEIKESIH